MRVLPCRVGHTLGRRTISVNEEREQLAGQNKYWSAGQLPCLPSSPAAWLVPALGQCLLPATTPGARRPGQALLPTTSLSQVGSCMKGRDGEEQACSTGRQWVTGGRRWRHPGTHSEQKPVSALAVPGPLPSCLWAQGPPWDQRARLQPPSCNAINSEHQAGCQSCESSRVLIPDGSVGKLGITGLFDSFN